MNHSHRSTFCQLPAPGSALDDALLEIRSRLGYAPQRLYETTNGRPIRFGRGKSVPGWAFVRYVNGTWVVYFGDWRTQEQYRWTSHGQHELPAAERRRLEEDVRRLLNEERLKQEDQRAAAARSVEAQWENLPPAPADHPYLARKGVRPHGLRARAGSLVVPLRDIAGQLWSWQTIDAEGRKRFYKGGRAKGLFFTFAQPGQLEAANTILVGEGWATGATLHETLALPVVAAMNASNLLPVVQALHEKYPHHRLVICADDDWHGKGDCGKDNAGLTEARKAAAAVGGQVAVPVWSGKRGEKDTDFNDLALLEGRAAVRRIIEAVLAAPAPGETTDSVPGVPDSPGVPDEGKAPGKAKGKAKAKDKAPDKAAPGPEKAEDKVPGKGNALRQSPRPNENERSVPAVEPAGQDAGGTPLSVCLADEHPLPPEQPFPIQALPELIRAAVEEVQDYTQAPTVLVAASALTAVSIAVQGLADVQINWMLRRPISLFLLTIAEPGERKTTCDGYFTKPLREFVQEAEKKAALELKEYRARMAAWEARREGLLKAIQKAERDGTGLGSSLEEQALVELEHQKPEEPPVPRLLYTDATTEALAYSLAHWWPSAGLVSSEAGAVFGGHSMSTDTVVRNLALLNQLWDGADFSVDRRTRESFHVRNVRLTIGLQVQPAVLDKFMDGHGSVSRGQGFLARCLLSYPKSTQGTRITKDPPCRTPGLDAFCQRLRNLLETPLPRNGKELKPPALCLAPKAHEYWKDYSNRTERRLLGDLRGVRDVGSKAAEHVARLAAVMYMFEQGDTDGYIGEEHIAKAAHIVDWYLLEARRFGEESSGAIDLSDAARLKRWLRGYCTDHQTDHVTCRIARNYGPIKDGKRFFAAVNQLADDGDAWVQMEGRRHVLRLNPTLLHDFRPEETVGV